MHNTYHVELQSPFYQQTPGVMRFIEVVDTMERIHKHNHSSYHNSSCMEFHKETRSNCLLAKLYHSVHLLTFIWFETGYRAVGCLVLLAR